MALTARAAALGNAPMARSDEMDHDPRGSVAELKVVQFNATYEGFGMVMDYLARRLPFAGFEAGLLTDAVHQQLKHGHHLVALKGNQVIGYAGWLLTSSEIAEAWIDDRGKLVRKQGDEATAAALTIVASEDRQAVTKLIRGARRLNPGKRAYFKRSADDTKPARKRSAQV